MSSQHAGIVFTWPGGCIMGYFEKNRQWQDTTQPLYTGQCALHWQQVTTRPIKCKKRTPHTPHQTACQMCGLQHSRTAKHNKHSATACLHNKHSSGIHIQTHSAQ
jgi:hypothetical protein